MKKILLSIVLLASFFISKAQLTPVNDSVGFNLTDITINNTILKRKASIAYFSINKVFKQIQVTVNVSYYADSAGTYGQHINANGIIDYQRTFTADNSIYVDTLGNIITLPYTGRYYTSYGFFSLMETTDPVIVDQAILSVAEKQNWN